MTQKIILIQDRQDNYHLTDACSTFGRKITFCDRIYQKKDIINTFTIDDSFEGLCVKCKMVYDKYFSFREQKVRLAKGCLCQNLIGNYVNHRFHFSDKEMGFVSRAAHVWTKLDKLKIKIRNDLRR